MDKEQDFIRWFAELGIADVPLVGAKNASLMERVCELGGRDFACRTAPPSRPRPAATLDAAGTWDGLHAALDGLVPGDVADLARRAARAAPLSPPLEAGILAAWDRLRAEYGDDLTVAVRSPAAVEDLPAAGFARQHEYLLECRRRRCHV